MKWQLIYRELVILSQLFVNVFIKEHVFKMSSLKVCYGNMCTCDYSIIRIKYIRCFEK